VSTSNGDTDDASHQPEFYKIRTDTAWSACLVSSLNELLASSLLMRADMNFPTTLTYFELLVQQHSCLCCDLLLTMCNLCTVIVIAAAAAQALCCSYLRSAHRFEGCPHRQTARMRSCCNKPSRKQVSQSVLHPIWDFTTDSTFTLTAALSAARCCRSASRRTRTFFCHRRRLIRRPSPRPCASSPRQ
jgi:hypothetical protein